MVSSPTRRINAKGLELVKYFEKFYENAYQCYSGVWTIGWGCTEGIKQGMEITKQQGEEMLKKELNKFETGVTKLAKVKLNEDQFSALVSFTYNIGLGGGGKSGFAESTLLKQLNESNYQEAADWFLPWNKGGKDSLDVLLGLARRRRAERSLFLGESWEWTKNWEPNLRLADPGQTIVQGQEVKELQKALIKGGFTSLKTDGYYGNETYEAVKQYQKQKGLKADGNAGKETLKALRLFYLPN
jgi:lysozyme